jgi:hypothetical protein
MPVVINEFEMIPDRPDPTPATRQAQPAMSATKLSPRELEKVLRLQLERLERIRST